MNENENQEQQVQGLPAAEEKPAEETKDTKAKGLIAEVAARVKGAGDLIQERYIQACVEKEVSERVGLLDKAMQKRFELISNLNKVNRPDDEKFGADGKPAAQYYTKARLEEIKKAKEALAKVENAIDKAMAGDWSKVKEVAR